MGNKKTLGLMIGDTIYLVDENGRTEMMTFIKYKGLGEDTTMYIENYGINRALGIETELKYLDSGELVHIDLLFGKSSNAYFYSTERLALKKIRAICRKKEV